MQVIDNTDEIRTYRSIAAGPLIYPLLSRYSEVLSEGILSGCGCLTHGVPASSDNYLVHPVNVVAFVVCLV
jgi:hypothetical protein